ncbi:hypothetical protein CSX11_31265 [Mycobacterium goodii]|nr:hypothetical protein CSX11_31265 [Mycolicibacterium goodii]
MEASARAIPEPPDPFKTEGTDPLSKALADKTWQVEAPFIEGMGKTKAEAQETARRIQEAADKYEQSDRTIAENLQSSTSRFDASTGAGGTSQGGVQGLEQLQQMMQMPMQAVQMAAQVPTQMAQMAQMAGQVPQAVMQGVQQIGQMTGGAGQNTPGSEAPQTNSPVGRPTDEHERDEQQEQHEGAAAYPAFTQQAPIPSQVPGAAASEPEAGHSEGRPRANGTVPRPVPSDPAIVL